MAAHLKINWIDETLTPHRLGVPPALRKSLATTNVIESCLGHLRHLYRNVKRWRQGMPRRWASVMLLGAEKGFRRINSYRHIPQLVYTLRPAIAARANGA